jgi:hypothetical protein
LSLFRHGKVLSVIKTKSAKTLIRRKVEIHFHKIPFASQRQSRRAISLIFHGCLSNTPILHIIPIKFDSYEKKNQLSNLQNYINLFKILKKKKIRITTKEDVEDVIYMLVYTDTVNLNILTYQHKLLMSPEKRHPQV